MAKTTGVRLDRLKRAHADMADHMTNIGIKVSPTDGLDALAEKLDQAIVPNGEVVVKPACGTKHIYQGDFVALIQELMEGDHIRFASRGVSILAAAGAGAKRVAVVFSQSGAISFKILKFVDNAMQFGNTLTLRDGVGVSAATVVRLTDERVVVAYNADTAGQMAVIDLDDRVASLAYTDVWDVDDPVNIVAAALDEYRVLVGGVRQATDFIGKAYFSVAVIGARSVTTGPEFYLNREYDGDEYAHAWSLAALTDSYALCSYFKSYNDPVQFSILRIEGMDIKGEYGGPCITAGSMPVTSAAHVRTDAATGMVYAMFVNGITRTDEASASTKGLLAVEIWTLNPKDGKFSSMAYNTSGEAYNVNLGCAGVETMGEDTVAVYYSVDNDACMFLGHFDRGGGYSPVMHSIGFDCFFRLIPLNGTYALLIRQYEGNGEAIVMRRTETVFPCTGGAVGIAKTSAAPHSDVSVIMAANQH